MSKGIQIAIGAAAIALLLGWYATTNLDEMGSFQYFQTLEEFRAEGEPGRLARVHGYVTPGSIDRDLAGKQVRFAVQNDPPHAAGVASDALAVIYPSLETPDLFKDAAEVIVEGKLEANDGRPVFHADNVLAKCPSKFRARRTEPAPFGQPEAGPAGAAPRDTGA